MEKNLTFNSTLTVEQFKSEQKVSEINIRKNSATNKLFFTYGNQVGAVASVGIPNKPMFSNVTTEEGNSFWLLHEEAAGAPVLATL